MSIERICEKKIYLMPSPLADKQPRNHGDAIVAARRTTARRRFADPTPTPLGYWNWCVGCQDTLCITFLYTLHFYILDFTLFCL